MTMSKENEELEKEIIQRAEYLETVKNSIPMTKIAPGYRSAGQLAYSTNPAAVNNIGIFNPGYPYNKSSDPATILGNVMGAIHDLAQLNIDLCPDDISANRPLSFTCADFGSDPKTSRDLLIKKLKAIAAKASDEDKVYALNSAISMSSRIEEINENLQYTFTANLIAPMLAQIILNQLEDLKTVSKKMNVAEYRTFYNFSIKVINTDDIKKGVKNIFSGKNTNEYNDATYTDFNALVAYILCFPKQWKYISTGKSKTPFSGMKFISSICDKDESHPSYWQFRPECSIDDLFTDLEKKVYSTNLSGADLNYGSLINTIMPGATDAMEAVLLINNLVNRLKKTELQPCSAYPAFYNAISDIKESLLSINDLDEKVRAVYEVISRAMNAYGGNFSFGRFVKEELQQIVKTDIFAAKEIADRFSNVSGATSSMSVEAANLYRTVGYVMNQAIGIISNTEEDGEKNN